MLNEAFKEIEYGIWENWRASGGNDIDMREQYWLAMRLLDDVNKRIHTYASEAEIAAELEAKKQFFA